MHKKQMLLLGKTETGMKSMQLRMFLVGVLFIAVGVQARHVPDFKIEFGRVAYTSVLKSDTMSVWG